jgi:hypothetical protein
MLPLSKCQTTLIPNEEKSMTLENDTIVMQKEQLKKADCIIGKWFIPHSASINITFYEDSTFIFNDFNWETEEEFVSKGIFEINGNKLTLKYKDRPEQIFKFEKGDAIGNYYITKGKNYYFIKNDID